MTTRDPTHIGPLPTFLIIGAMKAGTTSLYHYLREHPEVFMATVKELDFFAERGNWGRGLDWYRKQFAGAQSAAAVGEASTVYSKYPIVDGVPERIAACVPDCRLIYVLRDPIERIRSHYQHTVAVGTERDAMADAVFRDPVYLACSRYASQIDRYLDHFPREQLLLITSEELLNDRRATMRLVSGFLGIDEDYVPSNLGRDYYRTAGRVTYPQATWKLRHALKEHLPWAKRAKEFVDTSLPRLLRPRRAPHPGGTAATEVIPNAVRERLEDALREDVQRLHRYMPPGFGGWGISRSSS